MAELILGAVAFGLGTPGVIVAFVQCGESIQRKVQTFKDAPAIVEELGKFGYAMHQGKIKVDLELAEWASSLEDVEQTIKDSIGDHISKLRSIVIEADQCLSNMVDKNGQLRRLYFTFIGERKALHVLKTLKSWQNDFFKVIALIEMRRRVLPRDVELSRNAYRRVSYRPFSTQSDLLFGTAEVMRNSEATSISVLVEQKRIYDANTVSDIREVATILASGSFQNVSGGGILKCLGYREQRQKIELVFELPTKDGTPCILSDVITSDQSNPYGGRRSLNSRYRLARQLCDAVFTVFTSGLVHKNLRTNTILLVVKDKEDSEKHLASSPSSQLGSPYLTNWTLVRKATGLTSGADDSGGVRSFYRHPKRQGIQPEERYNFGHDIYSLGVCLLEIGLWAPFFTSDSVTSLSTLYKETAVREGYLKESHINRPHDLTWPAVVPKVLLHLAKHKMPQRMGIEFSQLIVSCLTCLEGGMGDPGCFKRSQPEAAMKFNNLVSQAFAFTSI